MSNVTNKCDSHFKYLEKTGIIPNDYVWIRYIDFHLHLTHNEFGIKHTFYYVYQKNSSLFH